MTTHSSNPEGPGPSSLGGRSREPEPGLSRIWCLALGFLALLLFAWASFDAARRLGMTVDEPLYLASSLALWEGVSWDHYLLQFHGPIALWPNHLLLNGTSMVDLQSGPENYVAAARFGMLPFGVLGGLLTFRLAWRAFGPRGGLLATLAYCLHPMVIGYAGLCNVDAAHAAMVLLAIAAAVAFERRPGWLRASGIGASLGLLLCTKYLSVLAVPGIVAIVIAIALRGGLLFAVRSALVAFLALVVTMHGAYGFRGSFASTDPDSFATPALASLAGLPGVGLVLGLFPGAWVAGLDMVGSFQDYEQLTWLAGDLALVQPAYFVRSIWLKSPELWTALLALALMGLPFALRRARRRELWLDALLIAAAVPPLLYMSFVAEIQSGIRYVHQCLVPLCVLIGSVATFSGWARLPRRWIGAGCFAAVAWQLFDTGRNAPDHLGYFTPSSGGRLASIQVFRDSNNDFGQLHEEGRPVLAERYGEDVRVLEPLDGPGFGRVAAYMADLVPLDRERADRTRHWLDAQRPVESVGSAWFVYEVEPADLERAAREQAALGDDRGLLDYAVALAAAGELAEARTVLAEVAPERAAALADQLARLEARAEQAGGAPSIELARAWTTLGRADLAVDELSGTPPPEGPAGLAHRETLGTAYLVRRQFAEAATMLDVPETFAAVPHLALVAADASYRAGRVERAIELLEEHRNRLPESLEARAGELLAKIREREQAMEHFGIRTK